MQVENRPRTHRFRLALLGALALGSTVPLIHRLYQVQVVDAEIYQKRLRGQTVSQVLLTPPRGRIYDRNGIALADNRASFDIELHMRELVGEFVRHHEGRLPKTQLRVGRGSNARMREQIDVYSILQQVAGGIFTRLGVKGSFTERDVDWHFYTRPHIPFPLVHNISFETLSHFKEMGLSVPGIDAVPRPSRHYNFGALAPHVIGYLGRPEEQDNSRWVPEMVGRRGIEATFERILQGEPGYKILRKNKMGVVVGEEPGVPPRMGRSVFLTIDARIQMIAEQAMRTVGRGACVIMDVHTGDVLAMVSVPSFDPNAFVPSIDHTTWQRLVSDPTHPLFNRALGAYPAGSVFKVIVAAAALRNPAIAFTPRTLIDSPAAISFGDRLWRDWYPGGRGPINLRTAMALSTNTFFYRLGEMTGIDSIVETSHLFGLGRRLMTVQDETSARLFGHRDPVILLEGESAGVIPGPEWMREIMDRRLEVWRERRKIQPNLRRPPIESWTTGHTYNTSIGQGNVEVSPLQMCTMIAAVANGGQVFFPRLVMAVTDEVDSIPAESTVMMLAASAAAGFDPLAGLAVIPFRPALASGQHQQDKLVAAQEFSVRRGPHLGLGPEDLQALKDSLRAVVTEGTGRRAASPKMSVAGKTGSAQAKRVQNGRVYKDTKTWFSGFAPYESPRYAITVMVEGGVSGGTTAGPIVRSIVNQLYDLEQGAAVDLVYLTPAEGHFKGMTLFSPEAEAERQAQFQEDMERFEEERNQVDRSNSPFPWQNRRGRRR